MNLKDLKKPFNPVDIEWRIGRCDEKNGKVWAKALAYITARAIHDRLDDVCGEANWQLEYTEHLNETVCRIGIKCGDEWVWKSGGAGKTEFEAFKGGLSSAEKRAGVPWGIGRYLYNLDETFVDVSMSKKEGWNYQSKNGKKKIPAFWWKTPALPKWALPDTPEPIQWTADDRMEFYGICKKEYDFSAEDADMFIKYILKIKEKKVVTKELFEGMKKNIEWCYSEYIASKI